MTSHPSKLNPEQLLKLTKRHAIVEYKRQLDDLMDTRVDEPLYEFLVQGLRLRGGERIYASDHVVRMMAGEMYGELESLD